MSDRTVTTRYEAKISGYIAATGRMRSATTQMASDIEGKVKKVGTDWERMGTRAQVAGLALGAGVALVTKRFADFDQAMSAASAALPQAGAKMDDLRQLAIKLGADTQFSATEAAQGITEMAKAGASAEDILGGGLKGALDLAAAGQLSVADAAGIAATAVKQYNLRGSESTHVADLYAAAAGKALGSVQDIALAQEYAGITAHSMGVSIEETTGVLALFASKGIIGEKAGTTFRSMLLSLTAPSKIAKAAMEDLGIEMYDARGKFVGIQGAADELQRKLGPLDEATRNQALGQIFGNEAINGAITLYEGGSAAVQQWTKDVDDAGFAARQAAKLTDNWKGDLERLGGSLDSVFVKNGSAANGMLRGLTQNLEDAVDAFGRLPEPVQVAGLGVAALSAGGLLLGGTMLSLIPKVLEAKVAVVELGIVSEGTANKTLALGRAAGIAGAAFAAAEAAGAGFAKIGDEIAKADGFKPVGVEAATAAILDGADGAKDLSKYLSQTTGNLSTFDQLATKLVPTTNIFAGSMRASRKSVEDYDQALAGLVTSGHPERAATFLAKAGISAKDAAEKLPQYSEALKGVDNQSRLAGESTSKLDAQMTGTADASTAAGSAILLMGDAAATATDEVDALAKIIQSDMDAAATAFARDLDVLSKYDPQAAADKAKNASEKVAAAEQSAQDVRERVAAKKKRTVSDTQALDRAATAVDKARAEEKVANAALGEAGLTAMYRSSIDQAKRFTKDISTAAQRGLDPQVVAKLLQEGPEKAGPALQALVGKNSAALIKMTNDSEAQIRALNGFVVEQARLTSLAVNSTTDTMSNDLGAAMGIAQAKATQGADATAESIAKALRMKVPEVQRIAGEFGIALASIPPPPPINVRVNTKEGLANLRDARQQLANLDGTVVSTTIKVRIANYRDARQDAANSDPAPSKVQLVNPLDAPGKKKIYRAGGGLVTGPGTSTSDSVDMRASNGEYVARAAAVDFYGKQFFDSVNSMTFAPAASPMSGGMGSHSETHTRTVNHYGDIYANSTREYEEEAALKNLTAH